MMIGFFIGKIRLRGFQMMGKDDFDRDILTISQVAEYLQLSEMTTYKLVNDGTMPAFKIGRHWRVKKSDLNELIEKLKSGERV